MTKKLFYENSYIKSFTAVVTGCEAFNNNYIVTLDQTFFFAEGGGQPADIGHIDDAEVFDVQEQNGSILHYADKPLTVNSTVNCEIDFARRFMFMQQHTGEHIVSGIINRFFGFDNVGFHIGSEYVTVDINAILTVKDLDRVEEAANEAIYKNIPVVAEYPDKETLEKMNYRSKKSLIEDVRIVTVPGFDKCACCGLHCAYTGEIGIIKLISAQKYKSGTRINMLCGERALTDYSIKNKSVYAISALLSAKPYEITGAVKKLLEENSLLKQNLAELKNESFKLKTSRIPLDTENICLFEENLSTGDLRRFCLALNKKAKIAAVFSGVDGSYKYAIGSDEIDVRDIGKEFNTILNGKGGGQKELVQGTVYADRASIEEFFK